MLIIVVISGYPGEKIPEVPVWQFDKLVHSIVYAMLSFLMLIPFHKQYIGLNNRLKIGAIVILFGVFYGGFMEFLQNTIFINRNGNWYDFVANAFGAIIGVVTYPIMIRFLPINRWLKIK